MYVLQKIVNNVKEDYSLDNKNKQKGKGINGLSNMTQYLDNQCDNVRCKTVYQYNLDRHRHNDHQD